MTDILTRSTSTPDAEADESLAMLAERVLARLRDLPLPRDAQEAGVLRKATAAAFSLVEEVRKLERHTEPAEEGNEPDPVAQAQRVIQQTDLDLAIRR